MNKVVSKESEMFPHIEAWKTSGLSQKAYCEQHQIILHVFYYWLSKHRIKHQPDNEKGFVPVKVLPAKSSAASMELIGSNGNRLVFFGEPDPAYIKSLLS